MQGNWPAESNLRAREMNGVESEKVFAFDLVDIASANSAPIFLGRLARCLGDNLRSTFHGTRLMRFMYMFLITYRPTTLQMKV